MERGERPIPHEPVWCPCGLSGRVKTAAADQPKGNHFYIICLLTKAETVLSFRVFRPMDKYVRFSDRKRGEKGFEILISQRSSGVEQLSCKQPVVGSNPAAGSCTF